MSLTILVLLTSLLFGAAAIAKLARKSGRSVAVQASGIVVAGIGLLVFFYGPSYLPHSPTRYIEPLAFGVAYCGQTLLLFWLASRR